MKQMTHGSQSLALIAMMYMWEGERMAKLCNGLIWNLILTYILKCGNDVQTVHPLSLNGLYTILYTIMKMQFVDIQHDELIWLHFRVHFLRAIICSQNGVLLCACSSLGWRILWSLILQPFESRWLLVSSMIQFPWKRGTQRCFLTARPDQKLILVLCYTWCLHLRP